MSKRFLVQHSLLNYSVCVSSFHGVELQCYNMVLLNKFKVDVKISVQLQRTESGTESSSSPITIRTFITIFILTIKIQFQE